MGLSNELSREAGSFSHCRLNPHRFVQSDILRLFFLPGTLGCVVCLAPKLFLLVYLHANVGLPTPPAAASLRVLSAWLPVSTPPTGLDDCFFFNSLVVGRPYSSIFWKLWLFFVFEFVVVLLLIVQRGKVCLRTPPSWPEVDHMYTSLHTQRLTTHIHGLTQNMLSHAHTHTLKHAHTHPLSHHTHVWAHMKTPPQTHRLTCVHTPHTCTSEWKNVPSQPQEVPLQRPESGAGDGPLSDLFWDGGLCGSPAEGWRWLGHW